MDDFRVYKIQVQGQVEEEDIRTACPLHIRIEEAGGTETTFVVRSDQSGLIGLVRYLHGMGLVLLSITATSEEIQSESIKYEGKKK